MKSIDKAIEIINKDDKNIADFVGPRSEDLVIKAEKALDLIFPSDYRVFLLELGAGNFGSTEICGVLDENFDKVSEIEVVSSTKDSWAKGMPRNLVLIRYFELGNFCLKTNCSDSESAVVSYHMGAPESAQDYALIAPSFGDYLLDVVSEEEKYA